MNTNDLKSARRPDPDSLLQAIADYVCDTVIDSDLAFETAHYDLFDALACAMLALAYPACRRLLGPVVPGAQMEGGVHVPGTNYELDPVQAAFNIGAAIRWLDFNDTWLAAEWGHPSDNLGGILSACEWVDQSRTNAAASNLTVRDVLLDMIKAHEIQGILSLGNSFNRIGLDHVLLVRVATAAVTTARLGGDREKIINALSNAWIDGGSLRTYRHAPNTGSRKSWAAGDATSRGLRLALLSMTGEMGYPSALTAPTWGFEDVVNRGRPIVLERTLASYVMENILFKISYPAEFHAQTAVEAAMQLHEQVVDRVDKVDRVVIETQEPGTRIIDKTGPLANPADRDHCIQYMTAIPLLFGRLTAIDYEDEVARDPRIDELRKKMQVVENERFTKEYYQSDKRAIGNAVQVFFVDGEKTDRVEVNYPIGHRKRREEGVPRLLDKVQQALSKQLPSRQAQALVDLAHDPERAASVRVGDFMAMWRT